MTSLGRHQDDWARACGEVDPEKFTQREAIDERELRVGDNQLEELAQAGRVHRDHPMLEQCGIP
jgi:hypothetical protein